MKRFILIIAAMAFMGTSYAQALRQGLKAATRASLGKAGYEFVKGMKGTNSAIQKAQNEAFRQIQTPLISPVIPSITVFDTIVTPKLPNPNAIARRLEMPDVPFVASSFTTSIHPKSTSLVSGPILYICGNTWAGEVWVEKVTYGEGPRTVTDWHLMATNTTGVGHCLEGVIIVGGREIPIVEYVSASANNKKNAVSIYRLDKVFSVKQNSFHSVEGWKCR